MLNPICLTYVYIFHCDTHTWRPSNAKYEKKSITLISFVYIDKLYHFVISREDIVAQTFNTLMPCEDACKHIKSKLA